MLERSALKLLALLMVAGLLVSSPAPPPPVRAQAVAPPLSSWVQLGPAGTVVARAVTAAAACPTIALDARAEPLRVRAHPSTPDYPVLVCEGTIPPGTAAASIEGQPLPLPVPNPRRIVVVGDTGCRMAGDRFQACDDPRAWPFAQVARSAAAWRPDLVIHVGDYNYREAPCPDGNQGCQGSPWGYTWDTINADLFAPAAPLLGAAPWVFVRGNHEVCSRNGSGWFRFLDPRPTPASCQDYTDPYAVPAGRVQLLVLDSANANDLAAPPDQVAAYTPQLAALGAMATSESWLLSHRPFWVFGHAGVQDGVEQLFRDNPTLQAASNNVLPRDVQLVLSGHLHLFELLSFSGGRPPQLVVGMSGTALDPAITTPLSGLEIAGAQVALGATLDRPGYLTAEASAHGWVVTIRDVGGAGLLTCAIEGARAACPAGGPGPGQLPRTGQAGGPPPHLVPLVLAALMLIGSGIARRRAA